MSLLKCYELKLANQSYLGFLFSFCYLKSNLIQLFFVIDNLVIAFSVPIFLTQI